MPLTPGPTASRRPDRTFERDTLAATDDCQAVRVEAAVVAGQRVLAFVRELSRGAEVVCHGQRHVLVQADRAADGAADASDGAVVAPMPGTVVKVRARAGQQVVPGDILGVMEAMRMEVALMAPHDGTVTSVTPTAGDQVALGTWLFEVTAQDSDEKAAELDG